MPRHQNHIAPPIPDESAVADPNLTEAVNLGGNREQEEERQAAIEKVVERELDGETSVTQRDLERENEELKAKLARLTKKWVYADYSDLEADHPFEVMIPRTPEAGGHQPVKISVNDHDTFIPRDMPTQVPKYVVEVLERARIKVWEKIVGPDDNPKAVLYEHARFPFTARPLYL